jgi:hypothetical protein
LHWKTWLEVERLTDLRPAGSLVFSGLTKDHPGCRRRLRRGAGHPARW